MTTPVLPVGTVTFFFSDIEGSTRLVQDLGEGYRGVLERHGELITNEVTNAGGVVVQTEGDGFFAVFASAVAAVEGAATVQLALADEPWPDGRDVRVRVGLHTGEGRLGGDDYVGIDVHRAARIADAGHGGQTLLSATTAGLVEHSLPPGTLLKDLGSHDLKDLAYPEHIYQLTAAGSLDGFPPLRTLSSLKTNLPRRGSAFVGRQTETEVLAAAVRDERLVTLVGTAGVGKTSLAIHAAEDLGGLFPDGIWLVEISRIADENLIASAVAKQLKITESSAESVTETLAARLARAGTLLILDGCEHLIDAVAKFTDRLLESTERVHVLTTSRESLAIRGEHLVRLDPLSIPPDRTVAVSRALGYDSVQLFVDRAQAAQPSFELDEANAQIIADICRRLDGIPLAIELAAARLKILSARQLVERLDHQFSLLSGGSRDLLPHQQTLEATLDWSFDFLAPPEQLLFSRLSVFTGGFTLEAVETVCADEQMPANQVLELLARLVDTSLVMAAEADPVRYRLLEPIAHYAGMRLTEAGEDDRTRERHAGFFAALGIAADEELLGVHQLASARNLDREHYNLRAALRWLHGAGRNEQALRLAGALRWFWVIQRAVTEGTGWLNKTLAHREGVPDDAVALALNGAGMHAIRRLDLDRAEAALSEALELYRGLGDERNEVRQIYQLSTSAWFRDDLDLADEMAAESQHRAEEAGNDPWCVAWSLAVRATMARARGQLRQAETLMLESHTIFDTSGGQLDRGWSLLRLAAVARDQGDYLGAAKKYREGRMLLAGAEDALGMAHADAGLGAMASLNGEHEQALRLYGSVLEGFILSEEVANNLFELKTMIQGNPSARELQQVVQWNRDRAGFAGELGTKAALGEYLYHVGKTASRQHELERARAALVASLRLCQDAADFRGMVIAFIAVGAIDDEAGNHARAVSFYAVAQAVAEADELDPFPPFDEPSYDEDVAASREALGEERFDSAWRRGRAMGIDAAIALAGG